MADMIPPKKPKNYSKMLDMLNTKEAAKVFSPKTYANLVGEYAKKALDNNELNQEEYMNIVKPLFGDTGIMVTEKIKQQQDYLNKYADGGRIGFLKGGDTKYNAMVTKMYIEAGGQEGTGMDIDSFAEKYFPKFATGGRVNYRGGDAARSDAASGRDAGRASPSGGTDDRSSEAQTAAHNAAVAAAQQTNVTDNKMNIINTLNKFRPNAFLNPYDYSINLNKNIGPFGLNVGINTLGLLGIDDPRTPVDESELDDYGISGGFNTDVLGGNLSLSGGYNPTTGTNFGLSFSKQFNQGGRVNYNEGSLDPDTIALKEKIEEIMDIEGVDFGAAFKQAMRELASQSKQND